MTTGPQGPPGAPGPPGGPDGALLAQILLKQGEMSTQLAVISEQLKAVPDHETRIRGLERFRWTLAGIALTGGALSGLAGWLLGHGGRI